MGKKLMIMLLVFLPFLPFFIEETGASDFYTYMPFLYRIPEGSAGVFKNGNQFYDDVYPAGVYLTWPFDEGFVVSIMPEKAAVTDIPCTTAEGIKITFPRITVRYQVHEQGILGLIKGYGLDFVKPLIKNPLQQGVAHLCGTMTAEAVYLDGLAMLKERLGKYLAEEQRDKDVGISICNLEIQSPPVPDAIIDNHPDHNPEHEFQNSVMCEQPYEIFYTLENEQEAINRLCGSGGQPDKPYQDSVPEEDTVMVLEPAASVVDSEFADGPGPVLEANAGHSQRTGYEAPQEEQSIEWAVDSVIDGQDSGGEDAGPSESRSDSTSKPIGEMNANTNTEPVHRSDTLTEINQDLLTGPVDTCPDQVSDQVPSQVLSQESSQDSSQESSQDSSQDSSQEKLYRQMQDSKGLWKNSSSQLYLGW
ncbi:SPFH domain-containing protein [Endozoicomonas sp. SCSIO W0465]|uniref:SPFH domain-containing protein n=1 Tax=Endozoicomonas sp. SCSIO W0465 TaxID=2918516 RepID=UPI00207524F4|nr:SPFH domain-containing protein [Endozoicomonas sp. SCSIO W0465]USE34770.1 hypothetical protein MJO57_21955 [Endozoicomonas sp. SCSIO W0465]